MNIQDLLSNKSCSSHHNGKTNRLGSFPKVLCTDANPRQPLLSSPFSDPPPRHPLQLLSSAFSNPVPPKKQCASSHAGREPDSPLFSSRIAKMFACSTCSAMFPARSELYAHYRDAHQHKLFSCSFCSKLFTRSSSLKTHIRVHTGERPYRCTECGKSFTQLSNVLQHNRDVHVKDKRFKCELCEKAFSRLETLQCHIRVHTGERIYKCEVCQKSFSQRANLKVHTRIHRGEKTRPKRSKARPTSPVVGLRFPTSPVVGLRFPTPIKPNYVNQAVHHELQMRLSALQTTARMIGCQSKLHGVANFPCVNVGEVLKTRVPQNKAEAGAALHSAAVSVHHNMISSSGLDFLLPTIVVKLFFDMLVTVRLCAWAAS